MITRLPFWCHTVGRVCNLTNFCVQSSSSAVRLHASPCYEQRRTFLVSNAASQSKDSEILKQFLQDPEERQVKVRLLDENGSLLLDTSKATARKMADERKLRLVEIQSAPQGSTVKHGMKTFQLISGKRLADERLKEREEKKASKASRLVQGEKEVSFGSSITEHDFDVKLKQIVNFATKRYRVRVEITAERHRTKEILAKLRSRIIEETKVLSVVKDLKDSERRTSFVLYPIGPSKEPEELLQSAIWPFLLMYCWLAAMFGDSWFLLWYFLWLGWVCS